MNPLKICFKILKTGNGKFLKTKDEVNNLIVEVINRNPSKASQELREIAIAEFNSEVSAQKVLQTSSRFFISKVTDIEVLITFLPEEKLLQDQFYTQWRYIQISEPYRLVQYLDENKVVVYSEKTKVLHTIKLEKDISIIAVED
ncbi:hypothetical protein [Pedobacter africanus]|uniref:Uncharacterized protein n=1 Tax=Pedobacter africanus TaxID=151894 RepID=A0ACC6KYX0_9SPHI|nr:hypothetical protein [Pedobacter africanus]MDR6784367.1 hypothetical protein [Pedobacter africanus]